MGVEHEHAGGWFLVASLRLPGGSRAFGAPGTACPVFSSFASSFVKWQQLRESMLYDGPSHCSLSRIKTCLSYERGQPRRKVSRGGGQGEGRWEQRCVLSR